MNNIDRIAWSVCLLVIACLIWTAAAGTKSNQMVSRPDDTTFITFDDTNVGEILFTRSAGCVADQAQCEAEAPSACRGRGGHVFVFFNPDPRGGATACSVICRHGGIYSAPSCQWGDWQTVFGCVEHGETAPCAPIDEPIDPRDVARPQP